MEGWTSILTLLFLVVSGVGALDVNIPQETYEFARGDDITLPCKFVSRVSAPKLIVITWSAEAEAANAQEVQILTYYYPQSTTDIKPQYEGRVSVDVDVATGKANLKLSSVTLQDNKVFECRVLIPGDDEGKLADTARLVVLVAPSTPICNIQGKAEYGQNINLTCVSEEGSPSPVYRWESRDVRNVPRLPHDRTTDSGGILSLYNIDKHTSGHYICTSRNKVASASCKIVLSVLPPSTNNSITNIIHGLLTSLLPSSPSSSSSSIAGAVEKKKKKRRRNKPRESVRSKSPKREQSPKRRHKKRKASKTGGCKGASRV